MPNPGSHQYDVKRTRLRGEFDNEGVPYQHADDAANAELQKDHPPVAVGDPDRAAGPAGARGTSRGDPEIGESPTPASGSSIELRSSAFNDHTMIPDRYAYQGPNTSPPLEWRGLPDGTEEIVLLCEDRDAPGGTFTHWILTGITPETTGMSAGEIPAGAKTGRNDFGEPGWGGPRPPVGDDPHRYFFRLFAVDRSLDIGEGADRTRIDEALSGHTNATGTLVGLVGR
ncbi:YbhB/YbcL family Raf kinase inhibitor-like protein [Nocardia carnea]|uniref:YbhB/YbcL family Raf kinase inhibitor-like protein n=1 Tax=Nocardia carnea TaxID=37328 RepID=UPI002458801A|nr:YbhB/YbcL family Raf kinase inhibitor-like protein [Nocardia carnea]